MQDLQDARRKRSAAVEAFDVWSQDAAASAWPEAAGLSDEEAAEMMIDRDLPHDVRESFVELSGGLAVQVPVPAANAAQVVTILTPAA